MTPENARDVILQGAAVRAEPVTLPPTVVVPPGQLGPGSLPGTVTGSDGTTIVHQGNFRAQTVVADQVDTRGLTIKNEAGQVVFSAGVKLDSSRINGLGALASKDLVDLAAPYVTGSINGATQVTNLGALAYASVVTAEKIVAGSFAGKTFTGGEFIGTTFKGINMSTENLYVNSVNATDELNAFNMRARGTSTITNLIVDNNIYAPIGRLDCLNVYATNDVRSVNLYATSSATLPGGTFVNGQLKAGSLDITGNVKASTLNLTGGLTASSLDSPGNLYLSGTGSVEAYNVKARWDLTTANLVVSGSISGGAFSNFLQRGVRYSSVLFNDGTGDRRVDITF